MIQLSATLSDALIQLIEGKQIQVDGIQVGPYFSLEKIRQCRSQLPHCQFHFHGNRIPSSSIAIERFKAYLVNSDSPWASMHIALIPSYAVWLGSRYNIYPPVPGVERATRQLIEQIARVKAAINGPVILENMPVLPSRRYVFQVDPVRISEILAVTQCNLLLDTAHARIAAHMLGLDIYDYLSRLPLEKVVQIHVSGSRSKGLYYRDVHEPLQEIDYVILKWVLARTKPHMLTLEYFKEREPLQEQIFQLCKILADYESNYVL